MDQIRQLVRFRSVDCQYHSRSLGIRRHFRTRGQCIGGSRHLRSPLDYELLRLKVNYLETLCALVQASQDLGVLHCIG